MYDSIRYNLQTNDAFRSTQYLTALKEISDVESGEIVTIGKLKNLNVKIKDSSVSIFGSMPKFYLGSNLQQLTRKGTQETIEKLSDELRLKVYESNINRIDVSANFIMDKQLNNYFNCLTYLRYVEKKPYKNGLQFETNKTTLLFYDKSRELKKKKQPIPELFQNRNILRYEVHFTKRLKDTFKQTEIIGKDLYQEDFYVKSVNLWRDLYFKIDKSKIITINPEVIDMYNIPQLKNIATYEFIKSNFGSVENYFNFLDNEQKNGTITKQFKSNFKKQIKGWSELPVFHIEDNEAIKELDSKVIRMSKYYR